MGSIASVRPDRPAGVLRLDRQQLLAQVAGYVEAAACDRTERRRRGPETERSIRAALELIDLSASLHGWPPRFDPAREKERLASEASWLALRRVFETS